MDPDIVCQKGSKGICHRHGFQFDNILLSTANISVIAILTLRRNWRLLCIHITGHAALCGSGGERAEDCYSDFITPLGQKTRNHRDSRAFKYFVFHHRQWLIKFSLVQFYRYYLTRVNMIQKVKATDVLLVSALEKDVRLCAV